nr:NADH-quinone oxidoreductase subunit L [Spirochaetota bacterium]
MIFNTLNLMLFLVGFPFVCSLILILITNATVRTFLLKVFAFVIIVVSLVLLVTTMNLHKEFYSFELPHLEYFFLIIEFAMLVWIIIRGIKYKKFGTILLVLIQAGLLIYNLLYVETSGKIENALFIDKFSLIIVAIIGIIGSLICIYAIGYMQDYHKHHKDVPNRRNVFAFYLFV